MNNDILTIEKDIIMAILNGEIQVEQALPSERELAEQYLVGRPRIREALQSLAISGWITIRKSKPAMVNDFWKDGNLLAIIDMVTHIEKIPNEFIQYFLEIRQAITPHFVKDAVKNHYPKVIGIIAEKDTLSDDALSFAIFDWELQKKLADLSHNPMYLLMLNSFEPIYIKLASRYFAIPACREASANYYQALLEAALMRDENQAAKEVSTIMQTSLFLWNEHMSKQVKENKGDI